VQILISLWCHNTKRMNITIKVMSHFFQNWGHFHLMICIYIKSLKQIKIINFITQMISTNTFFILHYRILHITLLFTFKSISSFHTVNMYFVFFKFLVFFKCLIFFCLTAQFFLFSVLNLILENVSNLIL
jgi:hypothetical protein